MGPRKRSYSNRDGIPNNIPRFDPLAGADSQDAVDNSEGKF